MTDLANDIIPLAEEGIPLIQNGLVLVFKIRPVGDAVFGLQARHCKGARGILASKDYQPSANRSIPSRVVRLVYHDSFRLVRMHYSEKHRKWCLSQQPIRGDSDPNLGTCYGQPETEFSITSYI